MSIENDYELVIPQGFEGLDSPPFYRRSDEGIVLLAGQIKKTTGNLWSGSDTLLGTLPVGYRPGTKLRFIAYSSTNDVAKLQLLEDGKLKLVNGPNVSSIAWVDLGQVWFYAYPE